MGSTFRRLNRKICLILIGLLSYHVTRWNVVAENINANHMDKRTIDLSNSIWSLLTPSIPEGDDIECYVEVESVRMGNGRCVQLGGYLSRPYVCISGAHFEFQDECQQIIEERMGQ